MVPNHVLIYVSGKGEGGMEGRKGRVKGGGGVSKGGRGKGCQCGIYRSNYVGDLTRFGC